LSTPAHTQVTQTVRQYIKFNSHYIRSDGTTEEIVDLFCAHILYNDQIIHSQGITLGENNEFWILGSLGDKDSSNAFLS